MLSHPGMNRRHDQSGPRKRKIVTEECELDQNGLPRERCRYRRRSLSPSGRDAGQGGQPKRTHFAVSKDLRGCVVRGNLGGLLGLPISFYRRVPAECFGRQSRLVQSEPLLRPERNVDK